MQQESVLGTAGSGPARVRCRNPFPSRWALICPAKSRLWDRDFRAGSRRSSFRRDQHSVPWRLRRVRRGVCWDACEEARLAQLCRSGFRPRHCGHGLARSVRPSSLEAGQTVVIHGAAGNVGAYAVQLARRARLRSIATAGTKDIEYVRALGADKVVDYHTQCFEGEVKDADAVLDLVGGETQIRSFQVLRPGGKLISTVSQPDQDRAKPHGVTAAFFLVEVITERLRIIAELIDRGELKTRVGVVLPLADGRDAHMMLEGRRSPPKGKIILNVEAAGEVTAPT